jgi:two-component system chemotaxis response regulator CheY
MNILIVDDSKTMRCIISRTLRDIGLRSATFLEASDGKEALKLVLDSHPQLIISDLNMPGMSGMELLQTLRAKHIPTHFGFVTSEVSPKLHQDARKAGALFVATKPFTATNLTQTLKPILADLGMGELRAETAGPIASAKSGVTFPEYVAQMLTELLRRTVTAAPIPMIPFSLRGGYVIAEYLRVDDRSVVACAILDVASAVSVGASLSLIPPEVAAEAIAARRVSDTLAENVREVLNVMSRLFGNSAGGRVCLAAVHMPGEPISAKLGAWIAKPRARVDVCVEIAGYSKGSLTLLSC